ncbi:Phosphorylated adapter RNA export protein [Varanus komodoensis]|uniref:Phosphorylated adapter RNA export protein n=1 Tax=Varanus komodoensis TaxID=61221 RepID=A0A8D2LKD5_VARKO|nr:phosphorylated adapter RNA export protein [Varanus komodoensis]KAF7250543.1 Phosphorylated adapter RNA export protein [Varanus komodoensis]
MALEARGMEQDVEDGEILESDCEMPISAAARSPPQKQHDTYSSARSFPNSISPCAPSISYRTTKNLDSSDESFSDSDEDNCLWKRKRQKCSNLPLPKPEPFQFGPNPPKQITVGGKKINNIWCTVLQDQNQDEVASELGILGMEGSIDRSRASETYNYLLAKKMRDQSNTEVVELLDKELDDYMQSGKKTSKEEEEEEENGQGHLKRKRPIKDRLDKRQEMIYKGRYEITEDDPEEKVADEIAYRLCEPKKDLIIRVVKIIGKKKSIELLMETAEVEQNGGLLIINGSRRRTPGGVYLNLLKNTPSITGEQIKEIFYTENQKEYENKKAAKKRRIQVLGKKMKKAIKGLNLQEYDDASRETFASDTNEALASLDDLQEGHGEMKLDPEDAIDIDNTHDLDIF